MTSDDNRTDLISDLLHVPIHRYSCYSCQLVVAIDLVLEVRVPTHYCNNPRYCLVSKAYFPSFADMPTYTILVPPQDQSACLSLLTALVIVPTRPYHALAAKVVKREC